MSRLFLRRLQSLIPFWGDDRPSVVAVRTLRLSSLLVVVFTPIYWAVYRVTDPAALDPLWGRGLLMGIGAVMLWASYRVRVLKDRPKAALTGLVYFVVLWYGALALINRLDGDYALGFMFVVISAAMVFSLVWDRPRPLTTLLVTTCVFCGVGVFLVSPTDSGVHPLLFMLVIVSSSVVVFCAFYGRLRTARDLRRSQRQLSDAERMAKTGAWSIDLSRGRRRWSAGMFDILGLDHSDRTSYLMDFVVPEDRRLCDAEHERMRNSGKQSDLQFRIVRPDGNVRWVRARAEMIRDDQECPVEFRGVLRDVTEQVMREAALEHARDEAEAATRAQSEFLANMSHEIRTPLTAIIGFAQMLREESDDVTLVEPIEAGGQRLLATLNSVLDLARMEAGQTDLVLASEDLVTEVVGVSDLLRGRAEEKGLALVVDVPDEPVGVLADRAALGRILSNLLSNAIKFTDEGSVTVCVGAREDNVELTVSDTGRGMDATFLNDLFTPFRQASTGWARSHEGTGLGMTITRRLVDAMGGSISVESEPGAGTRFTVRLQRARAATADASLADVGLPPVLA